MLSAQNDIWSSWESRLAGLETKTAEGSRLEGKNASHSPHSPLDVGSKEQIVTI